MATLIKTISHPLFIFLMSFSLVVYFGVRKVKNSESYTQDVIPKHSVKKDVDLVEVDKRINRHIQLANKRKEIWSQNLSSAERDYIEQISLGESVENLEIQVQEVPLNIDEIKERYIENARKDGWIVELNDKLEVLSAKPVKP